MHYDFTRQADVVTNFRIGALFPPSSALSEDIDFLLPELLEGILMVYLGTYHAGCYREFKVDRWQRARIADALGLLKAEVHLDEHDDQQFIAALEAIRSKTRVSSAELEILLAEGGASNPNYEPPSPNCKVHERAERDYNLAKCIEYAQRERAERAERERAELAEHERELAERERAELAERERAERLVREGRDYAEYAKNQLTERERERAELARNGPGALQAGLQEINNKRKLDPNSVDYNERQKRQR
ncbi:hypothetical protein HYE67_009492 [Fusarium culmorum]|uniref:Uncharacterized protein n=1 Tax=Fusarium culmorum TaxID=5516 RepID=A0A7S8DET1_FUSCU|nr:hypothetical protein HYE67_009492 [Fusarium culmorum]